MSLTQLMREVRSCRICAAALPWGPRPVLQLSRSARVLIVGQAPGRTVHQTGIPWNDASGNRLREWLQLDRTVFYDASKIAILPIGLCYPGAARAGGDNPPRPECAPRWHRPLLGQMPRLRLTLLLGQYAHRYYLASQRKGSLTATVYAAAEYAPQFFPLPHPSWRSVIWMRRHPWFEAVTLAHLRRLVAEVIAATCADIQ